MANYKRRRLPDAYDVWAGQKGRGRAWKINKVTGQTFGLTPWYVMPCPALSVPPSTQRASQYTESESHPSFGHPGRLSHDQELRLLNEQVFSGVGATFGSLIETKGTTSDADTGGPFLTRKYTVDSFVNEQHFVSRLYVTSTADWVFEYQGPVHVPVTGTDTAMPSYPSGDLKSEGTTAIARCAPTNNVGAALNALIELRTEGLPKLFGATLWKERTSLARSAGEEYLNKEFGWAPLVSDMKGLLFNIANAHTIMNQYERDSGRVVRRRFNFPIEESTTSQAVRAANVQISGAVPGSDFPGFPSSVLDTGGTLYKTTHTMRKVWFSGAFTYHLPTGYKSRVAMIESAQRARTLLGLRLTPEVVWNATPWTWAIDWFSNAGDVVANLSRWASDGQVLKYGYVMEHYTIKHVYTQERLGVNSTIVQGSVSPAPISVMVEQKRRVKATPFGFNVDWPSFSPRQIAIAVALGLTKR